MDDDDDDDNNDNDDDDDGDDEDDVVGCVEVDDAAAVDDVVGCDVVGFCSCDVCCVVALAIRGVDIDDGNGVEDNDGDCIDAVLIALLVMVLSLLHSSLHFLLDSTLLSVVSFFERFFLCDSFCIIAFVAFILHSVELALLLVLPLEPHPIITLWTD